ncbi:class I SAM-dependent methyltransferase [Amycolatopsis jiangsuensis]|uniref:Putative O-methyltransferase YrrM n=1 Tax=Amycolatopsis jiangsuensis TaxID=1181879 RepID=A0A840IP10_9PSEU|nr:class I SAM-dependent methyltransferase [Amycolatopsis jiangsuensis]MBB4682938.1 putative O-methyltransferase YrrM [Amycolatopsis jiangsuensis]
MDSNVNGRLGEQVTLDLVDRLYREHAEALRAAREAQRAHRRAHPAMKTQLDDVEAEITYLLLRHFRPEKVVEIGSLHGWSTSWILRALADNGTGRLITADLIDHATGTVPESLSAGRWEFRKGDAKTLTGDWRAEVGYLFVDADHRARFAKWYLAEVFPTLAPGTPVSVHDVFHRATPLPFTEGAEVLRWLERTGTRYFTASRARAPRTHARLGELRRELGLTESVHTGRDNPMLYFRVAARSA